MRKLLVTGLFSLTLVSTALAVNLRWDPPAIGTPVGYTMYRGIMLGQSCNASATPVMEVMPTGVNITGLTFTDTEPVVGANYYEVTAFNSEGESLPSNRICFQRQAEITSQPLNLRIVP